MRSVLVLAGVLVLALTGTAFWGLPNVPAGFGGGQIVFSTESPYQNLYVTREEDVLALRAGSLRARSSALDLNEPYRHVIEYTEIMMLGLGYVEKPEEILILGLGGGTLTRYLRRYYPEARITNVEIDRQVVEIARNYFQLQLDDRMELAVEDARRFLTRTGDRYDLIFLDAYHGDYIPFHLLTREFLELVRRRLRPGGAVVANTWAHQKLYRRESATYAAVFGRFDSYLGRESSNRIVVARKEDREVPVSELQRHMAETQARKAFAEVDLPALLDRHFDHRLSWPEETPILVDDYAPVNFLVGGEEAW